MQGPGSDIVDLKKRKGNNTSAFQLYKIRAILYTKEWLLIQDSNTQSPSCNILLLLCQLTKGNATSNQIHVFISYTPAFSCTRNSINFLRNTGLKV